MGKNSHKSFFLPLFCGSSRKDVVKHTDLPDSSFREPSSPKLSWTGKIKKKSTTITTHDNHKEVDDDANNNSNNNNDNDDNNRFISSSTHEKSFGLSKRYAKLQNLFSVKNLVTTPIDATCINKPLGHSNRYTKHHNLVPGKSIVSPAIETTSINNNSNTKFVMKRSKSHNERRRIPFRSRKYYKTSSDDHDIVRVEVTSESDPLPVVKCPRRDQEVNVNLLKRRGIEMKTLQIQPMIQVIMDQNTSLQ